MRAIFLSAALAAAAVLLSAEQRGAAEAGSPACAATQVRYAPAKHPTLGDVPWALASPPARGVVAFLVSYAQTLRDGRVNRADGLVLWQTGEQIVWSAPGASASARVVAERPHGSESVRLPLSARADGLASTLRLPAPGCWRLTFRHGPTRASVVARVVARPVRSGCDATPVGDASLAVATPRAAGIAGGWTWRTGDGRALMYTHGVGPGALNAKVPWWVRRNWGAALHLTGTRLDGRGRFRQTFSAAGDPSSRPQGYGAVFPSIVDVPRPGCWLFTLRTGRLAGVLVVRAVER